MNAVAKELLGTELFVFNSKKGVAGGIIVETEAYDETDEASHSHRGQTKRNVAMFGEPGAVYVYFTYGMHVCMNISAGDKGFGAAVLIRAIEPTVGIEYMWQRRFGEPMPADPPHRKIIQLTNGPAKLTQALGVTLADNRQQIGGDRFNVTPGALADFSVRQTTRVGISKAIDRPWRWCVTGNEWVSKR